MSSSTAAGIQRRTDQQVELEQALQDVLSQNFDADTKTCLITILKMTDKLLQNPSNAQVRSIRLANPNFAAKVGSKTGGLRLLRAVCGFVPSSTANDNRISNHPFGSQEIQAQQQQNPEFYTLPPEQEDVEWMVQARHRLAVILTHELHVPSDQLPRFIAPAPVAMTARAANTASSGATFNVYAGHRYDGQSAAVGANLGPPPNYQSATERELNELTKKQKALEAKLQGNMDRQWQIWTGNAGPPIASVSAEPTSSKGDAALIAAAFQSKSQERQRQEQAGFTTKAMRDLAKLKQQKVYEYCVLQIKFPFDNVTVQGRFGPKEKLQAILDALSTDILQNELESAGVTMQLYQTPPRRNLDPTLSLVELQLVPASKVFVSFSQPWTPSLPFPAQYLLVDGISSSSASALPTGHQVNANASAAPSDEKPKAAKKNAGPKQSREEALLQRMMGKKGGLLGGRKSAKKS